MEVAKHELFHDGGSCRIQTSALICSANQWTDFCTIGISVVKDSRRSSSTYAGSLFLHVVKHNLLFLYFFSIRYFFHEYSRFTGQQVKREESPFYNFHLLHRHLDIRKSYCCRELTSAHSWQPESNMKPLVLAVQNSLFLNLQLVACTGKYFLCLIKSN